jgi:hypothetical protein
MVQEASQYGPSDEGSKGFLWFVMIFPNRAKMQNCKRGENEVSVWFQLLLGFGKCQKKVYMHLFKVG